MFRRFVQEMTEFVFFLGSIFGLFYALLIVASPEPLFASMKYYFWMLLPLVFFGLLFGLAETFRKVFFTKPAK